MSRTVELWNAYAHARVEATAAEKRVVEARLQLERTASELQQRAEFYAQSLDDQTFAAALLANVRKAPGCENVTRLVVSRDSVKFSTPSTLVFAAVASPYDVGTRQVRVRETAGVEARFNASATQHVRVQFELALLGDGRLSPLPQNFKPLETWREIVWGESFSPPPPRPLPTQRPLPPQRPAPTQRPAPPLAPRPSTPLYSNVGALY